jgi:hypothetical protein
MTPAGAGVALPWSEFDDRRLSALILAMFTFPKILAEFPEHGANAVRAAWERLFYEEGQTALERAMFVLGDRSRICRSSATGLRLDGRPSSAAHIVAAANLMLKARCLPLICYVDAGKQ